MVGHQYIGMQCAPSIFQCFPQPVLLGEKVIVCEEASVAVMAALNEVNGKAGQMDAWAARHGEYFNKLNRAWPLLPSFYLLPFAYRFFIQNKTPPRAGVFKYTFGQVTFCDTEVLDIATFCWYKTVHSSS